jgi:hypothetical protein
VAGEWRVVASLEDEAGLRCMDLFVRPDGSYGFEEYRRDPEAGRWQVTGGYSALRFTTVAEAREAAVRRLPWLGLEGAR